MDDEIDKIEEEVEDLIEDLDEIPEEETEDLDDVPEEDVEIDGGIFDEDLDDVPEEDISTFDIGSTILASAPSVESWAGQNLEDELSRTWIEKDWGDEEEFIGGDFYKNSDNGNDFYGSGLSDDLYRGSGSNDLYRESGRDENSIYNTGDSSGNNNGMYIKPKSDVGSYDEFRDKRRGGRSMLEIAGYEDYGKKDQRDLHDDRRYEARDAA